MRLHVEIVQRFGARFSSEKCQFIGAETFHMNVLVLTKFPLGEVSNLKYRIFVERKIHKLPQASEYWRMFYRFI